MRAVDYLMRNYYEVHGGFEGIDFTLDSLFKHIEINEDDLYNSIGFYATKNHSAKEVYNIIKHLIEGNLNKYEGKVTKDDLTEIEKEYKVKEYKNSTVKRKYITEINILSAYLYNQVDEGIGADSYGEAISSFGNLSRTKFKQVTNNGKALLAIGNKLPKTAVKSKKTFIAYNTLFSPKVDNKILSTLTPKVLNNIIYGRDDMNPNNFYKARKIVTGQITALKTVSVENYREIIYMAMSMQLSVKDFLELCRVNVVNLVSQYLTYKAYFYTTPKGILLTVVDEDRFVDRIVTDFQLESLIKSDLLSSYKIEGKVLVNYKNPDLSGRIMGVR